MPRGTGRRETDAIARMRKGLEAWRQRTDPAERPLSVREELFCQGIANGLNQAAAIREAGYNCKTVETQSIQGNALLKRPRVKRRVEELVAEKSASTSRDRESYIRELEELAGLAKRKGNLSVMAKAIELKGRMLGFYVERSEVWDMREQARMIPAAQRHEIMAKALQRLAELDPAQAQRLIPVLTNAVKSSGIVEANQWDSVASEPDRQSDGDAGEGGKS